MIQCDDTEFVTLGDRTVVSRSSRYKGIFTGNKLSLLFFSCFACRSTSHRRARGLFRFRFSIVGSDGPAERWSNDRWQTGQQSEHGRYFKHGVVSGELSANGCFHPGSFESSIARCIALVQVQDTDGLRRRRRCEEQRRTLGRRRAGRQRRGGDTIGRVPVLGGCERLWQLLLRGVRQLQERALVQL